ncbi:MAG: hypothetical protein ACJAY5_001358 [Actinomycetes bacterium]|jgi:hypothetical protein
MEPTIAALSSILFGIPVWAWIAVGIAVIGLLTLVISVAANSKKRAEWDRAFYIRRADARWFADSLTLSVADRTKGTPELVRTWTDGVPRISTLSQQLYELTTIAPSDKRARQPRQLATAVDNLRGALDADVRLRTQGFAPGQDAVVAESAMVVAQHRRNLDQTLAVLSR